MKARVRGYRETAVVLDADGTTIVATLALEERGKGEIAPLSKLPHVMFIGGGVVIKLGDETIVLRGTHLVICRPTLLSSKSMVVPTPDLARRRCPEIPFILSRNRADRSLLQGRSRANSLVDALCGASSFPWCWWA
jgi:hypothetical protein